MPVGAVIPGVTTYNAVLGYDRTPSSEITGEDFLLLLIAQLQNQDPMDTMDQQEMMQQIATMTSVQQQQEINDQLAGLVTQNLLSSALSLVGHSIKGYSESSVVQGTVDGITIINGTPVVRVGDETVPLDAIVEVS